MAAPITISNTTRGKLPSLPFDDMKDAVLGKNFELSLAFVGEKRASAVNRQSRNKTYAPNVLSFLLEQGVGEMYICPEVAKRQAKDFSMTYRGFLGYLFIHGLLHLKGMDHGATMDKTEQRLISQFKLR